MPGGKCCGIGSCVNSRGLKLRSEITLEKGSSAKLSGKPEAISHGLHPVLGAECRNGRIERVGMSRDLVRGFAFLLEKDVAGEEASDGVCHGFSGATVQIDSGIIVTGE